jgi:hypothetical protein
MNTYKYLPPERIGFLANGLLRFTQPAALNDPFECIPILSVEESRQVLNAFIEQTEAGILDDILNEGLPRLGDWEAFQQRKVQLLEELNTNPEKLREFFFQRAEQKINASIGIFCLAKRWDSGLMWSHYASSHTGFCLGFHRDHPFFLGDGSSPGLRDVSYSENRIKVPLEKGITIDFDVMFTKSIDWKYEQEERMLFSLERATKVIDGSPYKIHLFEVPRDAISEVIIGARASDHVEEQLLTFCSVNRLKAFRTEFSSSAFDMLRVEASPNRRLQPTKASGP